MHQFEEIMKRLAFLFILSVTAGSGLLFSQPVSISGKAQNRIFEKVQVRAYADQFSHLKESIAETTTDEEGNFKLTFDYTATNYVYLSVELLEGEFYLVPGSSYHFDVFPDTVRKGSVYDQLPLQFNLKAEDGGLNDNLARFNTQYNAFVTNHFNEIYRSRSLRVIDEFRNSVEDVFQGFNNSYFNSYVEYSIAQLEWVSKKKSTKTIVNDYFAGKPILFNNIQYTDFFKSVFKEYVVSGFYAKYYSQLVGAIKDGSFQGVDNIFSSDEVLANDAQLRELVLMQTVAGFYHNPDFSDEGIIKILSQLGIKEGDAKVREIAGNYISRLTHLAPGTPAPDFQLPVSSGKLYSPKDFKGQVVIFDFMKADCHVCLAHLDFLKDLASRMGSKLKIVMLVYGSHPEKITLLLKKQNLDWPVLYVGKRIDVLDAYDVKIFPTYIILNPDATIAKAPASMADENLENEVERILRMVHQK